MHNAQYSQNQYQQQHYNYNIPGSHLQQQQQQGQPNHYYPPPGPPPHNWYPYATPPLPPPPPPPLQNLSQPPPLPPKPEQPLPPGTDSDSQSTSSYNYNSCPPPPPPPPSLSAKNMPKMTNSYSPLMPPPIPPFMNMKPLPIPSPHPPPAPSKQDPNLSFIPIAFDSSVQQKVAESANPPAPNLLLYEDIIDQKLPKELKLMFQPLYCKLCTLTLSSPIVARDHYKGKKHKKKIEVWVSKYKKANNTSSTHITYTLIEKGPVIEKIKSAPPKQLILKQFIKAENLNMNSVTLGSNANAEVSTQNIIGPTMPTSSTQSESFSKNTENRKRPSDFNQSNQPHKKSGSSYAYCDLCNVNITSKSNEIEHMRGKRHKDKLKGSSSASNAYSNVKKFQV